MMTRILLFILLSLSVQAAPIIYKDVTVENNLTLSGKTPLTVPILNASGAINSSSVTPTELGFLSGVTSAIQTQINSKGDLASPDFTGVPTAPTASVGTSTNQLATTAFVLSQGFTGASGSMPYTFASSATVVTSATTTYVSVASASIVVTASSAPVWAKGVATLTVTGSVPTVAKVRVAINSVGGPEQLISLTATTTNYVPSVQFISAPLTPGTYTVDLQVARNSGSGTVSFFSGAVAGVALQGASSNGITALSGLGLSAGPGSGSQAITGTLSLAGGGTNASLTAANGAIPYSTATALAFLAPGSSGQLLRSGGAGAPTWTTATFPATTTISQLLYSSANNVISGLATANTSALVTSSTGVPSLTSGVTANRLLRTNGTTVSFAQANLTTDVTGTLPFAQGGTGTTAFANQRIPFSNGTNFTSDGNFTYDTTNQRLIVGGSGTSRIGSVVPSGSTVAFQAYSEGTNNAVQIRNNNAYALAVLTANDTPLLGSLVGFERSRGTQTSRTQALSGDTGLNFVGSCYTGSASSTGFNAAIQYLLSENCTAGGNGGEISILTTPNASTTLVERVRITNDGLVKSKMGFLNDTSGSQPTCDSSKRGLTWLIQGGAGVADLFQVCMKDAADAYAWVTK